MNTFTVTFFGHRDFGEHFKYEKKLEKILRQLLSEHEYVEFLVGRNGEFDIFVSSVITRIKKEREEYDNSLTLVLPYLTAEYINNESCFENYYDEIEICEQSEAAHFKSAIQIRNRALVDRADLVICCLRRRKGGAFKAVTYAQKCGKPIINLAE